VKIRFILLAIILLTMVTACAPFPGISEQDSSLPPDGKQAPEESFSAPPTTLSPSAEEAVRLVKEHLAGQLEINEVEIKVVSVVTVNWPDTSLGLPEPGKMYAQVIVSGFRIVLSANGKEYQYHAGELGGQMVVKPAPP
jgi:hypothetical protein